jgi:hypothetical protein
MIVTDGEINDIETTKNLIREAEDLPLSVLVVKIGTDGRAEVPLDGGGAGDGENKLDQIKKLQFGGSGGPGVGAGGVPGGGNGGAVAEDDRKRRNIFRYIRFNSLKGNPENLAKKTFKQIPKQFLEYYLAREMYPKKNTDSKVTTSKREIKKKLEEKRRKSEKTVHPIVEYLSHIEKSFIESVQPVGYNLEIVKDIIENWGLRAYEFNLLAELVAEREKELEESENKPIKMPELAQIPASPDFKHPPSKKKKIDPFEEREDSALTEVTLKQLEPTEYKLYTKDQVPEGKKNEW